MFVSFVDNDSDVQSDTRLELDGKFGSVKNPVGGSPINSNKLFFNCMINIY